MTDALRIAQLYPDLLGVTGDRGNVDVLATRARARGVEVEVATVGIGDDLGDADIIVIGNGPLSAMRSVLDDLRSRGEALRAHVAAGRVLFAVGGGAEALSHGIRTLEGETIEGAGVLGFRAERRRERRVGYLVADTAADGQLVAFEDHASEWQLDDASQAWATVLAGSGSVVNGREGLRAGSALASAAQGPVLPLNPQLADVLIDQAAQARGIELAAPTGLERMDEFAAGARDKIHSLQDKQYTVIGL